MTRFNVHHSDRCDRGIRHILSRIGQELFITVITVTGVTGVSDILSRIGQELFITVITVTGVTGVSDILSRIGQE